MADEKKSWGRTFGEGFVFGSGLVLAGLLIKGLVKKATSSGDDADDDKDDNDDRDD